MKICPHCEAELKDSVIRCVRCGRSLREEPDREPVSASVGTVSAPPLPSAPAVAVAPPRPAGPPPPTVVTHPPNLQVAMDRSQLRALPTRRAWGPDWFMLLGGLMAAVAGTIAYLTVERPWVHLSITNTDIDGQVLLTTGLSLRGKAAFVGTAGIVLAIALAAFGLVWFLFGFQKGWTMPGIVNPALGFLVAAAGLISTVLASLVWFTWEDAMVAHARAAGLTTSEMRELLDLQPAPLVEIERLPSLATFGLMMGVGFLAAGIAWYAYRRRD